MLPHRTMVNHDSAAPAGWHRDAVAMLVNQAKQGDRRAFAELYQSRLDGIGRYVGAMVRDPDLAEDVVAETFTLAWRDLPKLRKHDRFDAWLYKIAHNQAITELRRPRTTDFEDAPEPADEDRTGRPELNLYDRDDAMTVREALTSLPEPQRQVLQLRFFQDLSSIEIAQQLGKTEQAIHSLQYRAIANLRRIIDDDAMFTIGSWVAPRPTGSTRRAA